MRTGRTAANSVLGGFIAERQAGNRLKLDPPIPSRDFQERSGQTVGWSSCGSSANRNPTWSSRSCHQIPRQLDGGVHLRNHARRPVVAQCLIVLLVYASWMWKEKHSAYSLILGGTVLVLTPWVPVIFGLGTVLAAVINFTNILLGAYVYKYYFEGREQYT